MNENLKTKIDKITDWALEKKAENILHYDVEDKTNYTDSIIICSGSVPLHNRAIANFILEKAKTEKMDVLSIEGKENGEWILIDLNDVIVNIFTDEKRKYYDLEDLFNNPTRRKRNIKTND